MNQLDEVNAKMQAEKAYYAQQQCGQAVPAQSCYGDTCGTQEARPSMRSQAEINARVHQEQAEKHGRAAKFFRENPGFDEFIQLVRAGAIQF